MLIDEILNGYVPEAVVYLDRHGTWQNDPQSLRDRISNEIWHAIWLEGAGGELAGRLSGLAARAGPGDSTFALSVLEAIYHLVAEKACRMLADELTAEWDAAGRVKKRVFAERAAALAEDATRLADACPGIDRAAIEKAMMADGRGAIRSLTEVIAEEESVRYQLRLEPVPVAGGYGRAADIYDIMHAAGDVSLLSLTRDRRALLRICLEILNGRTIPMESGLQFQASAILGVLQDIRGLNTIIAALDAVDKRNTNVRTNLVYALGMLCDRRGLPVLCDVLRGPADIVIDTGGHRYRQSLNDEKCEAIWALGKLGEQALDALPVLSEMASNDSRPVRIALAWALGTIGQAQKERSGGIDARVTAGLLKLLAQNDVRLGEEVMQSMKNLNLPEFTYELHLQSAAMVPVLSLKPSCTGLYEISETLFHLLAEKEQVIIAVTGDSGTGKTYFCEALRGGFGQVTREQVLYLMRDAPENRDTFNRILGIRWLKENVDPRFYADYPVTEADDDPDRYLDEFSASFSGKRLVLLDGWLDDAYFSRIIKAFHSKALLDMLVSFRTAYSTRRLNLEEREGYLENLNICLGNTESRPMEQTEFYYDPNLLIYILDNSRQSRLNQIEIKETFQRQKIGAWGDHIRIENFEGGLETVKALPDVCAGVENPFDAISAEIAETGSGACTPVEARFERSLNDDPETEPDLLQVVHLRGIDPGCMVFYAHGQLAVGGRDGAIGLLTGLTDQQLVYPTHRSPVAGLCCLRGDIFSFDASGVLKRTDPLKNRSATLDAGLPVVTAIGSDLDRRIVTGHDDGTVCIWDPAAGTVDKLKSHVQKVTAVAAAGAGQVVAVYADHRIDVYDTVRKIRIRWEGMRSRISAVDRHMTGRVVLGTVTEGPGAARTSITIADLHGMKIITYPFADGGTVVAITGSSYGRVIAAANIAGRGGEEGVCAVLFPERLTGNLRILGRHGSMIRGCIAMGPRIITCGAERSGHTTLRIWGTESYVRTEREKLRFLGQGMKKPPFYHMVF